MLHPLGFRVLEEGRIGTRALKTMSGNEAPLILDRLASLVNYPFECDPKLGIFLSPIEATMSTDQTHKL